MQNLDKEARVKLEELMLGQAIKELLYSFRKNGGDLDYCEREIRKDFEKAGYRKLPEGEPPLLSDEEIQGFHSSDYATWGEFKEAIGKAQRALILKWMKGES